MWMNPLILLQWFRGLIFFPCVYEYYTFILCWVMFPASGCQIIIIWILIILFRPNSHKHKKNLMMKRAYQLSSETSQWKSVSDVRGGALDDWHDSWPVGTSTVGNTCDVTGDHKSLRLHLNARDFSTQKQNVRWQFGGIAAPGLRLFGAVIFDFRQRRTRRAIKSHWQINTLDLSNVKMPLFAIYLDSVWRLIECN